MAVEVIDTTLDNALEFGLCGYKDIKHDGLRRKLDWLKGRFANIMKKEIKRA